MCIFFNSTFPQPSPDAPKTPPFPSDFALALRKCLILSRKRPTLSPVFPCQALFLSRSSQVPDSKPNRVSASLRGSPPPICYPEYRAAVFKDDQKAGGLHPPDFWANVGTRHRTADGWPTSACFWRMWGGVNAWSMWACLSFNPCIFRFLPQNIGGGGIQAFPCSFQTHNLPVPP